MNCPNCKNCEIKSICDKCDGSHTFSYKKNARDLLIVSCMKHRNPNFPEDEFIDILTKHWYKRGKDDGSYETRENLRKIYEAQKKESWW